MCHAAGVGWNKGGVCVGLQLGHTDICFINSHLAAHQSKTPQRNCDYSEIVGEGRAAAWSQLWCCLVLLMLQAPAGFSGAC